MFIQNRDTDFSYSPKINLVNNMSNIDSFYKFDTVENSAEEVIKQCFNTLYEDGRLLEALYLITVEYSGVGQEDCCWTYIDEYEINFDKNACIYFSYGCNEDISEFYIGEAFNFELVKIVSERFCRIHPEWKDFLHNIVLHWTPKY